MRAQSLERPPLIGHFPFGVKNLQEAFVTLRLGVGAPLNLLDDLTGVSLSASL
jgi:hypothetical protein